MNVDWDRVAEQADNTPRAVLAEFLGMADDIDTVVVVIRRKNLDPNEDAATDFIRYSTSGAAVTALGLIRYAQMCLEDHIMERGR